MKETPLQRKLSNEELRRIFRDFFNESCHSIDEKRFVPHAGKDINCKLCRIERKYIIQLKSLLKMKFVDVK